MIITLTPEASLTLAAQILDQQAVRVQALSNAVAAQRAINENPGASGRGSTITLPLVDIEQIADAMRVLRQVVAGKLEFK